MAMMVDDHLAPGSGETRAELRQRLTRALLRPLDPEEATAHDKAEHEARFLAEARAEAERMAAREGADPHLVGPR